jgi:formate-dependent nitrite reductase cytochrome c552 subunit
VPAGVNADQHVVYEWEQSAHARAGVNCADCHQAGDPAKPWVAKPSEASCARCHNDAVQGFLGGRHGMRLAAGLPAMTPGESRLPMRADAAHRTMTCNACHDAHRYDTRAAAVDACLKCHDDGHSRAYNGSVHQRTWLAELSGEAAPGSGVSCATCHLPRERHRVDGHDVVRVQHNQNANLRPNEKMIRSTCLDCHGYAFALDALADRALIDANFNGRPARHLETIEMVARRLVSEASPQPKKEIQP